MTTKRAPKGSGSIYKKGDTWYGYLSIGKTTDGKQKRIQIGKSKKKSEVQAMLNEAIYRRDHGEAVQLASKNAGAYFTYWLEEVKRPSCRSTATWAWYDNIVNKHLIPAFGTMKLTEITKPVIQRHLNAMSKQENPPYRTIKGIRDTLKQIFDEAVQDDLLRGNPVVNVVLPKPPKKSQAESYKAFSPEMRKALIDAADRDRIMAPIIHFLLWNGNRIGEVLALNWEHIDFEEHTVRTEQAVQRVYDEDRHYEEVVGGCKTPTSIRTNYMPEVLEQKLLVWRSYLESQPDGQKLIAPSAPVFPSTRTWKRRTYSGFRSSYRHFLERNGLPTEHMNLHRFRHTTATMMLEEGINPRVVQEELGHADIKTTLGTYSHVIPSLHKEVAKVKNSLKL